MYGSYEFKNGEPLASNFDHYRLIRMMETPQVEVHFIQNSKSPTGLGGPGLPLAGGAVANAIQVATGRRILKQPFISEFRDRIILTAVGKLLRYLHQKKVF